MFDRTEEIENPLGTLIYFRGGFYKHEEGRFYRPLEDQVLRRVYRERNPEHADSKSKVDGFIDKLKSAHFVEAYGIERMPHWIVQPEGYPDASELLVLRNGLYHLETDTLYPHTPELLTFNCLPFEYDTQAGEAVAWKKFLNEVFDNDAEAIRELQKLFGYLLTTDTSLQKIFALIGPRRSGKGTIARMLEYLLGRNNVTSMSMAAIGDPRNNFGMMPMIDKQLAIFPDVRISRNLDKATATERLLSISGEDTLTIDRKNKEHWSGRLIARLLLVSNEMPIFGDASEALIGRYIIFETKRSFYGCEDRELDAKLRAELPAIFQWAVEGLRLFRSEGFICTPQSAKGVEREFMRKSAPVAAWIAECCEYGPHTVNKGEAYHAFQQWHRENDLVGTVTDFWFHRDFRQACGDRVALKRPRVNGEQLRTGEYYEGIGLKVKPMMPGLSADNTNEMAKRLFGGVPYTLPPGCSLTPF